ncbi:MAG TPA: TIGR04338 family metallohydrolase [Candidatus Nanopelagicales bacterium]|nr:TIGR04338 family metallohydrolase [Candidatus Nanopelagicales bacterium]
MTDRHRQAVYRAEDQWSSLIDRGGSVDFFGSTLQAPVQLRFGRLEEVITYVDRACTDYGITPPSVRHRKGGTRAHYSAGVIAIPTNEAWAMRESVVLHEIGHHICVTSGGSTEHDEQFTAAMLVLVRERLGHEAELLLRTGYAACGAPLVEAA